MVVLCTASRSLRKRRLSRVMSGGMSRVGMQGSGVSPKAQQREEVWFLATGFWLLAGWAIQSRLPLTLACCSQCLLWRQFFGRQLFALSVSSGNQMLSPRFRMQWNWRRQGRRGQASTFSGYLRSCISFSLVSGISCLLEALHCFGGRLFWERVVEFDVSFCFGDDILWSPDGRHLNWSSA